MRCLVNAQTNTPPGVPWGTQSGPDTFLRVRLVQVVSSAFRASSGAEGVALSATPAEVAPAIGSTAGARATSSPAPKTGSTLPLPDATAGAAGAGGAPSEAMVKDAAVAPNSGVPAPTVTRFYLRGSDLRDAENRPLQICSSPTSPVPGDGQWLEINVSSYTAVGGPVDPPTGTVSDANHWVIVRFDADGCVTGIGMGSPGAMIGNSCWVSAGRLIPRAL
jgi:hypothetical protein